MNLRRNLITERGGCVLRRLDKLWDGHPGQTPIATFNAMSPNERRTVLKRCRDVVSGGYDRGLVALCRILQSTASR
ncbi:hypothetical protein [Sinorhizobium meliloti]|uniref:hypothetical protein n=1 Tax=Rhizobium meliloti TaxID=382 RepID=UPI00037D19A8|nr:hypothetical protein [Sinorhizobium meliloti]